MRSAPFVVKSIGDKDYRVVVSHVGIYAIFRVELVITTNELKNLHAIFVKKGLKVLFLLHRYLGLIFVKVCYAKIDTSAVPPSSSFYATLPFNVFYEYNCLLSVIPAVRGLMTQELFQWLYEHEVCYFPLCNNIVLIR